MSVSAEQCRAGRALIGWSQDQLSQASGVAKGTIAAFEGGRREPYGRTLADLVSALETAGVIFIEENGQGPGVRLRKAGPLTFLQFIRQAEKTNDAVGDFIGDARMDRTMPDATNWPELEAYLEGRGAIQAAIDAGEATWDRFIATRDAKAKR